MTPGLGPPRPAQRVPGFRKAHTDGLPVSRSHGRSPNGVAKRFPDRTAVGFRVLTAPPPIAHRLSSRRLHDHPDPFVLGSHVFRGPFLAHSDTLGPTH